MNYKLLAISALAVTLCSAALLEAAPGVSTPEATAYAVIAQDQDRGGWDAPPGEFREVERKGFHDGVEGARKDFDNHRRPDVNNRDEYRHPDVPRGDRADYREGFRRGYQAGVAHLMGGGPPR